MMKHLNISNNYNIIPSTGVSKIDKLISILIGWGYDFKILLDFDKAGYDEHKEIKKFHNSLEDKMYFVNQQQVVVLDDMNKNPQTIENLISKNGSYSIKTLSAKEFHDKVKNGQLISEEETHANFSKLFKLLDIN